MSVTQRVTWAVQPQYATGINRGGSIRPPKFAWSAAVPTIDQASGLRVAPTNGPGTEVNGYGRNARLVAASSQYFDCGTGPNVTFAGDMTVMVAYSIATLPGAGKDYQLFSRDNNSGGRSFTVDVANLAGQGVRFYTNGGGSVGTNEVREGRTPVAGDRRVALIVWSPSRNVSQVWIDGVLAASSTAVTNPPAATTSARIGARAYPGFQEYLDGNEAFVFAWDFALTAGEIGRAFANPWQLFAPLQRTIWVPVSAGGAVTTTASLDAAIQAAQTATASVSAAIQASRSGTADIAAAIQIARTLQATIDGAIQAPGSATASVNAYVQAGSSASTSLDAAIQRAVTATASLQAAVQASAAATASVNAYIQAGTIASASVSAAIQVAVLASANLSAAIATARSASASLGAVVAVQNSFGAAVAAAIRANASAAASINAFIQDDTAATFTVSSRARLGTTPLRNPGQRIGPASALNPKTRIGDTTP